MQNQFIESEGIPVHIGGYTLNCFRCETEIYAEQAELANFLKDILPNEFRYLNMSSGPKNQQRRRYKDLIKKVSISAYTGARLIVVADYIRDVSSTGAH